MGEVEPGLTDEQRHALVEWLKSDENDGGWVHGAARQSAWAFHWWLVATGQTVGGEADYVRKTTDHRCHCCKQIPGLCVCWETTSYRCSPAQHAALAPNIMRHPDDGLTIVVGGESTMTERTES